MSLPGAFWYCGGEPLLGAGFPRADTEVWSKAPSWCWFGPGASAAVNSSVYFSFLLTWGGCLLLHLAARLEEW